MRGKHGEQGADSKFPEAGTGIEVGKTLVAVGFDDRERQGGDKDRVEDEDRGGEEVPSVSVHKVGNGGKSRGQIMKICPWMESDQKCWKGDFAAAFWA